MTLIEVRPHHWGWKVFEAPGVEPVFPEKRQAIDYAQCRASFRSGEIRILDSTGKVERAIAFNEKDREAVTCQAGNALHLIAVDHLRRRFAPFKLCAHFSAIPRQLDSLSGLGIRVRKSNGNVSFVGLHRIGI